MFKKYVSLAILIAGGFVANAQAQVTLEEGLTHINGLIDSKEGLRKTLHETALVLADKDLYKIYFSNKEDTYVSKAKAMLLKKDEEKNEAFFKSVDTDINDGDTEKDFKLALRKAKVQYGLLEKAIFKNLNDKEHTLISNYLKVDHNDYHNNDLLFDYVKESLQPYYAPLLSDLKKNIENEDDYTIKKILNPCFPYSKNKGSVGDFDCSSYKKDLEDKTVAASYVLGTVGLFGFAMECSKYKEASSYDPFYKLFLVELTQTKTFNGLNLEGMANVFNLNNIDALRYVRSCDRVLEYFSSDLK